MRTFLYFQHILWELQNCSIALNLNKLSRSWPIHGARHPDFFLTAYCRYIHKMGMPNRILLIDSYDSYTFNLQELVARVTGAQVVTIHNDSIDAEEFVTRCLPQFDAVVVGPGPGTPRNAADVGILNALWALPDKDLVPVFGVCLGFQSMAYASGGDIERLRTVKHGQPSSISFDPSEKLFEGLPQDFKSVRYNSLYVSPTSVMEDFQIIATTRDAEEPTVAIPMAGKHKTKPFYGVQYHPESICSEYGAELFKNFWILAREWSEVNGRKPANDVNYFQHLLSRSSVQPSPLNDSLGEIDDDCSFHYKEFRIEGASFPVVKFCELLPTQFALLHSGRGPGRWTIIGCVDSDTTILKHYNDSSRNDILFVGKHGAEPEKVQITNPRGLWGELSAFMAPSIKKYKNASKKMGRYTPFAGGLLGYFSYEESCAEIPDLADHVKPTGAPDTCLADVKTSIIVDNVDNTVLVVSLTEDSKLFDQLLKLVTSDELNGIVEIPLLPPTTSIDFPDKATYVEKIKSCQELLHAGESYELCLCGQTRIDFGQPINPWDLYKVLLHRNPAPHSCYLSFDESTLVGASPERFMSWRSDGQCEFRPIKGTVKKAEGITKDIAQRVFDGPKERGENLMIVDLIRHDLNSILENVEVTRLMTMEEYESVYQLVSVITGKLHGNYKGIDVLAYSLPPGSMTGAPKFRSVQLLRGLEDYKPRGIYSGVSGYWSVTDEGDWSVVIRSAMSYAIDKEYCSVWRIGAGGAITVLSDPEEEWEEMQVKLESALRAFGN